MITYTNDNIELLKAQNELIKKQNLEILQGEYEQIKVVKEAIRHYGYDHQIMVAVEEMGELLQALSKFKRHEGDINNIIEEIADVEIMMQQLCLMFECYEEVVAVRRQKIERLKKRLENDKNNNEKN